MLRKKICIIKIQGLYIYTELNEYLLHIIALSVQQQNVSQDCKYIFRTCITMYWFYKVLHILSMNISFLVLINKSKTIIVFCHHNNSYN